MVPEHGCLNAHHQHSLALPGDLAPVLPDFAISQFLIAVELSIIIEYLTSLACFGSRVEVSIICCMSKLSAFKFDRVAGSGNTGSNRITKRYSLILKLSGGGV